MSLPLFFPPLRYVKWIDRSHAIPLEQLCAEAGVRCEAVGAWVRRPIVLLNAVAAKPWLRAEPGDWGAVEVGTPPLGSRVRQARWALGALAFVLFDGVARATVQGKPWALIERARGPAQGARRSLTNAERQRNFQNRRKEQNSGRR